MAFAIEHQSLAQRPQRGLCLHDLIEARRIDAEIARVPIEVARHADHVGADRLLMLVLIVFCDSARFSKRGADTFAEPSLHSETEKQV